MSTSTRKYATIKHPTIEALVNGLYRYKQHKDAKARFQNIADYFVLSKEQPESQTKDPVAVFWVKGYAVDDAASAQGFSGQFCEMRITRRDDGLFTLMATRVDKPLASHPQKKRPASKHPNWGHPIMRAVKRAKVYATIEAAQAELDLLHLEFPEVSIPGPGKVYIIIYEKREGIARPTHKIAIEIEQRKEGGFILKARDNEKKEKPKTAAGIDDGAKDAVRENGYFANKVLLSKKKRRRNSGRPHTGLAPQTVLEE